ncbi:hypothetical protein [Alienimonas chondri]|uniref:Uncharacterized protein n=1 Tax=Alienimonas chondri TaxID=2681879 RepID=A0ABX1VG53_9PLAN|nr:hypothetical protein [Alienimonas chondri]NNJ26865.1 hypothetical protein [Alienimonas chondri]
MTVPRSSLFVGLTAAAAAGLVALPGSFDAAAQADAASFNAPAANVNAARRQYYSNWHYSGPSRYHYRVYHYKPTPTYTTYHRRYVVYYPQRPRYVYYYNPYRNVYLGRFDLEAEGEKKYSKLEAKDQKGNLDEIPEKAFPALDQMPVIPDAEDGERMAPLPEGLPDDEGEGGGDED